MDLNSLFINFIKNYFPICIFIITKNKYTNWKIIFNKINK